MFEMAYPIISVRMVRAPKTIIINAMPAVAQMPMVETGLNFNKISIYNLPGQKVYYHQNPGNYLTIPTTEIPPGIYILQIDFGNKTDIRKISINR